MPPIVVGNIEFKKTTFTTDEDYHYEYPDNLDLKPGSVLHNKLRDMIMEKAFYSAREMSNRHSDWNSIDQTLTAYIPLSEEELRTKKKDSRKPVSIVFPNSYAVLETLLAYYVGAFFQDPIFRYEGYGPDDVFGAILLEKVIEQQCYVNKVPLNLHTQGRDAFSYGFGASVPTWKTKRGRKRIKKSIPTLFGLSSREVSEILEDQIIFEGNALTNIDCYKYLPDTNVPIHEPQSGEFIGWVEYDNYYNILEEEKSSEDIFNVRYVKKILGHRSAIYPSDSSGRSLKAGVDTNPNNTGSKSISKIRMFVKLIPEEYGLSDNEYPEVWFFEVVQDEIITQATPLNLDHSDIPVSVMAPDYDGYSVTPISRIEMLYGMQGVLDFMFNSHVANVRKAINDTIIYDPYQVNTADLKTSEPGKHIRLRRPAWGKGVKDVIQQLGIADVTRGNVTDSNFLVQWMNRIGGADENMQGSLRQGGPERLTGVEFQGTRAGGITRVERLVKLMGIQGMQEIGTMFAAHNRQFMTEDTFVKANGQWQDLLIREYGHRKGRIAVSPSDIDILYSVKVRDGSVPGGNFANHWLQLFQILAGNQELAQNFDVVRIFTHIARNLGAKNVNDFVRRGGNVQPQLISDDRVGEEVRKGNIIPINEAV